MSDDGRVVAYSARLGDMQYCVVDGRKGAPHRHVGTPALSRGGRTVAYVADGSCVVVNGRPGPRFHWVGNIALSRDGHVAYSAEDDAHRAFVVVDDRPQPAYDRVTRPVFSDDGRVVAYGARRAGHWFVVAGGRTIPADCEIASVYLSADGSRTGFVLEKHPRYDWIGWPAFAPDGRVCYFARRGATTLVVADGREIDLGRCVVWDPALGADGRTLAYSARIGRELWRKTVVLW